MADKLTALANFTANFQVAVMIDQNMFDNGQTQASSPCVFVATGVSAIEPFGQPGDVDRVDADTGYP